jgi:hypothetical protein
MLARYLWCQQNKEWDSGNYLEHRQREVILFSKEIDVRANWDVNQILIWVYRICPNPKKDAKSK